MTSTFRRGVLGTSALIAIATAAPACAQDSVTAASFAVATPQAMPVAVPAPQKDALAPVMAVPQIVISNPGTTTTALDTVNLTGVGQMTVDEGGGFIATCTGTLINPRTVIFAAHCVNESKATDYGANSGGKAISFGFANNNLGPLQRWLFPTLSGAANPFFHKTNVANALYNANQVAYLPGSLEPDARSFLYSDVALGTLDTPAAKIPTWALLFSALPATKITSAGTGYHVTIEGYGTNGQGQTGQTGSDFRRRIAENMLGALTSVDTFEQFLFGSQPGVLTQNLYFIDFDDPRRSGGCQPL